VIVDDLLFAIIIAGVGLAFAYLRAEFAARRRLKAAAGLGGLTCAELAF
jgi:hypothetical protein